MSDLRKGFLPTPKKQDFGKQQQQQEQKETPESDSFMTPTSEVKPRKQMKSVLYLEVSQINSSGQMSIKLLIKVVLNLQEEIRKLRIENLKLSEQIQHGLQDTLDSEWLIRRGSSIIMEILARIAQLDELLSSKNFGLKHID